MPPPCGASLAKELLKETADWLPLNLLGEPSWELRERLMAAYCDMFIFD